MNKYAALYINTLKTATRQLTKEEEDQVDQESKRILPRIFRTDADPAAYSAANPTMRGIGGSISGALMGGTAGAALGSIFGGKTVDRLVGSTYEPSGTGAAIGGLLGGTAGAAILAFLAHKFGKVQNANLKETMKRIPHANPTQADISMDPLVQHRQQLAVQAAQAAAMSSMATRR